MAESTVATPIAGKYLRLHLCRGIGAIRFGNLLRDLGTIDDVLGASVARLEGVERIGPQLAERIARQRDSVPIERELDLAARTGVRILCLADADYPPPLKQINDPPACLYVRGTLQPEDTIALGIVGSRHCSHYGAEQAERFGALLANAGLTVVSGMARGIDAAAHRGALTTAGRTLAVLGCGLAHLYPSESIELAQQIAESGALLSELPMEVAPDSKNFPPRNRIIAGLSLGVLVVEAASRSGALISARLASEYNREVFVIPGRIDMPQAQGCHELIQKGGAKLVTRLEDILDELGETGAALMPETMDDESGETPASTMLIKLTDEEQRVLKALGSEPIPLEAICESCDLAPAKIAGALTTLQLKGAARRVQGDMFERSR